MAKINTYNRLDKLTELGNRAELFCDRNCYDVTNMNVLNMMIVYEPEILQSEVVTLFSDDAGNWKWNRDRKKWERS